MDIFKKNNIIIIKDELFLEHLSGIYHPEAPERLKAIYKGLQEMENLFPISYMAPKAASTEELALIHDLDYIFEIEGISLFPAYLDLDTLLTKGSFQAAQLAAGGLIKAVDSIMAKEGTSAFALVRPPGHHAEKDTGMGFCLFNNIAIAARYVQKKYGLKRVLICDWDVHHGNGTQHAFYNDPSVLYFSVHQYPHYPGTGKMEDTGSGAGEGYTINCPLPPGQGDAEYYTIFREVFTPIALSFRPELILVSAGFDAYIKDPLARMNVTEEGFSAMTGNLLEIASECCPGRLIFTLEGGYDLKGLTKCVCEVIKALSGNILKKDGIERCHKGINQDTLNVITRARALFSKYWQGI